MRDYYALLPGDRDAGWELLTRALPEHHGTQPGTYDVLLGSVDGVRVSDVTASPPGSVTATVTYHFDDGRVFVERTSYRLVRGRRRPQDRPVRVLSSVQR